MCYTFINEYTTDLTDQLGADEVDVSSSAVSEADA